MTSATTYPRPLFHFTKRLVAKVEQMAVRAFDLTESQSARLTVVEATPSRRGRRRLRRRFAVVGVTALLVPFVAALVVLEVAH